MIYKKPHSDKKLIERCTANASALPTVFTLCMWNLQKSKRKNFHAAFGGLLKETDLFLVQEIRLSPQIDALLENSALHWTVAVSFLSLKTHYPTGIAIGSKAKPERTEMRDASLEPLLGVPKMTMASLINIADTQLLVINVHAINFKGINAFRENIKQAEALLSAYKGPMIIAGDFNTWSRVRLLAIKKLAFSLNMREVRFKPDNRSRFFKKPVDYIFYRGLKLKESKVILTDASDHNPLLATFEFNCGDKGPSAA